MQSCPQCREVYGTVGIRNLILESIIVKLKPKSQIQKKPTEGKKHGNNHGGAKKVLQDIGNDVWICNDRNQFGSTYQHQRQQEQFQQQQQHQMWQQFSQGMQRLRQQFQLEEEEARQHQLVYGHQMSR